MVEEFRNVVRRLASPGKWNVVITVLPHHAGGIMYEDAKALSVAINDAKQYLRRKRVDPVIIDITSGKATCSAVGASLALQTHERFQYVSTTDRRVRLYDLRYYSRELPLSEG